MLKFSFRTDNRSEHCLVATQNNGQIAFSDASGLIFVTPYRPEIWDILLDAGYKESYSLFVPFSNGEERPEAYQWLAKIAEEENLAYTCEEANKVAVKKGIKPVEVPEKYQIKEFSYYDDNEGTRYSELAMIFLHNNSKENIGTYIIIDEKTLVICDEYGRTWLVKVKTVINNLVNSLLVAGYTRTAHPEWYIKHYELDEKTSLPEEVIE